VSNEQHRFVLSAQLQEVGAKPWSIVLEPLARGTAPALAAALLTPGVKDDDLMLAVPTDHFFGDPHAFREAVFAAASAAREGRIVVFGLSPQRPETGLGYIQAGDTLSPQSSVREIRKFVEKPDAATAERLVARGDHFWNLGVFLFQKSALLAELDRYAPEVLAAARKSVERAKPEGDVLHLEADSFAQAPKISIDYAVMEKTGRGAVQTVSFPWSDLGTWNALWEAKRQHSPGANDLVSIGDVRTVGSTRSYLRADSGVLVVIGVQDLIVVANGDATLIAARDRTGDVGAMVEVLKTERRREARNHLSVHRPWGHFLTLAEGPGYQVKMLTLEPHASISLQYHKHRAERWTVVEGEAEVYVDGAVSRLKTHASVEIACGVRHRLSNPLDRPLKVIEVQSGDYLGEDDIIRLDAEP
jgi:mannose-1-phosphate guanylyltransferase/mannose-6-phosphate isomerase